MSENGNGDANGSSGSSTMTTPAPASGKSRPKKHTLRLPGMPPIGLSTTTPLVGTPYASSHAPPFEYPFPSATTASTQHVPLYIPTLEIPAHSPFPFAPALLSRGNISPFGYGKVHSLGLGMPMWRRSASPPHPKFAPSKVDPPVPPRLKDRVKEKVQSMTSGSAEENDNGEKQSRGAVVDDGSSRVDTTHEPDNTTERDDAAETEHETARPASPDVT